jgi:hypothetical protein
MSRGFRFAMSNPGALLVAGNPRGKKAAKRSKRRNPSQYQTASQAQATTARIISSAVAKARALERRRQANKVAVFIDAAQVRDARARAVERAASKSNPRNPTMARKARKSKKPRSAAQRAATARMLAANRSAKRHKRKARRASAPIKRRAKRRSSGRRHRVHNVPASTGTVVVVRKVRRGAVRHAKRRSGRALRAFRVNPAGSMSGLIMGPHGLIGSLGHVADNLKSVAGGGIKSMAIAAAAGAGSIVAGTVVKGVIVRAAMKVAPVWSAGPVGARVLTGLSYYGTGWAIARFAVKDQRTKSAILAGTVIATALEIFRPGTVTDILAKLPIVGDMFGKKIAAKVAGMDADLGAYVEGELGAYVEGYQNQVRGMGMDPADMIPSLVNDPGFADDSLNGYQLQGYQLQGLGIGCDDDE